MKKSECNQSQSNSAPLNPAAAKLPRHCEHVMTNGEFCQAMALRGRKFCHCHLVHRARRIRIEHRHELALRHDFEPKYMSLDIPLLEDSNAIQLALSNVAHAVMNHMIDDRRAGLVLYALQSAVLNLRNGVNFRPGAGALAAESYDNLEEEIGLGDLAPELRDGPPPASAKGAPNQPPESANVAPSQPPAAAKVAHEPVASASGAPKKPPQVAVPARKTNAEVRAAAAELIAALGPRDAQAAIASALAARSKAAAVRRA